MDRKQKRIFSSYRKHGKSTEYHGYLYIKNIIIDLDFRTIRYDIL